MYETDKALWNVGCSRGVPLFCVCTISWVPGDTEESFCFLCVFNPLSSSLSFQPKFRVKHFRLFSLVMGLRFFFLKPHIESISWFASEFVISGIPSSVCVCECDYCHFQLCQGRNNGIHSIFSSFFSFWYALEKKKSRFSVACFKHSWMLFKMENIYGWIFKN